MSVAAGRAAKCQGWTSGCPAELMGFNHQQVWRKTSAMRPTKDKSDEKATTTKEEPELLCETMK
jgi:hypothetical protein